jgi:hypothetical protein
MWTVLLATLVAVGLASHARADAPPGQYDLFDQTDVEILDLHTGLTWQRIPGPQMNSASAAAYCQSLALPSSTSWRLPSYKELLTLVDESPHPSFVGDGQPVAIDNHAFPGYFAPSGKYWSSSQVSSGVYDVDFMDGTVRIEDSSLSFYVRCVSGPTGVHPAK